MRFPLVSVLLLLASGPLLPAQTNLSFELSRDTYMAFGVEAMAQGDFNGDGKPDMVFGGGSSFTEVTLRLGNGDGSFQPPITVGQADSSEVEDVAAADLNQDGKLDVIVLCIGGTFDVFLGNGDGTFQPGIATATTGSPRAMAVGDFNGDNRPDLAIGDSQGAVEIFNNTDGKNLVLANTVSIDPTKDILNVKAGDFDDTGIVNLAVLTSDAAYVLWNDSNGGFKKVTLTGYTNPAGLNVGDLNQDGMADILISYDCHPNPQYPGPKGPISTCEGVDVFYGQGQHNTFQRHIITADTVGAARYLWAADVNGDGIGDLVAGTFDHNGSQTGLFIWLGHPDGSFDQSANRFIATSSGSGQLVVADFNRDGMIDFAQALPGDAQTQIYLNATNRAPCATSQINPTVTVCQPVDNTYLPAPAITVEANAYDTNQITSMQLYVNGSLVYSRPVSGFHRSFQLGEGSFYLVAKAWDYTGLNFRSVRHVTLYNGTPGSVCAAALGTAEICLPSGASATVPVHIVANGYTSYVPTAAQLYIDGSLVINNTSCNNYGACPGGSSLVDTYQGLSSGSHDLVFKLWDANGNIYSADKTITVQ